MSGIVEILYYLVLSPSLGVISLQSCHIGEEDEGGEQEGEEPSFEVRQTEMVWGDQGKGHRGVSGEATPHAVTTPGHHTRHTPPPPCYNISFFISPCLFSLPHSNQLFISCYGGLTCACLCWLSSRINVTDSFCFICYLAWLECREMVQLKTTKWNPGSKQTSESLLAV